jgi:hypothetical protein
MKLKPSFFTVLAVAVCLLLPSLAALPASADLEGRIQRVESGLLPPIVIKGRVVPMTLMDRLKFYKVPGVSIAVISGGKLEWARGYGVTAAEGGKPVSPDTLFQAASISKPFAAMIALHLVDEGKLSLDEDVNVKLHSWKTLEKTLASVSPDVLRSYTGEYQLTNGTKRVVISFEEGHLFMKPPQLRNKTEIFPESDTFFFTLLGGVPPVRFNRKDDGSMELSAGGMTAKRK